MRWGEVHEIPCSIARALAVVGERWTLLILREIFFGARRFDELRRRLGIARNVLATRLDHLVDHGVLEKVAYQDRPARYEYRLTRKGRELYPVLLALLQWGDRWQSGTGPPSLTLVHTSCGAPIEPVTACGHCGDPLAPATTRARMSAERLSAPSALDSAPPPHAGR
ncbi:MAG: helix-turn-helix domain-containing protein [Myxococcota bacterium]|nr:helix-turn-helix domain-containing protein [Myxococcota bacterium]